MDLLLTRLVINLELAVVDVFLAVVAVAVVCLLFLFEGDLRVQLGGELLGGSIWRTFPSAMGFRNSDGVLKYPDGETERSRKRQQI